MKIIAALIAATLLTGCYKPGDPRACQMEHIDWAKAYEMCVNTHGCVTDSGQLKSLMDARSTHPQCFDTRVEQ